MDSYSKAAGAAGDEDTGSDFVGDGEEDHEVAGGWDSWFQRPASASDSRTL